LRSIAREALLPARAIGAIILLRSPADADCINLAETWHGDGIEFDAEIGCCA
jgi:hypothetical protein